MSQKVIEQPVSETEDQSPSIVLFTDEEGLDLADDVELIPLSSATLGALTARRC